MGAFKLINQIQEAMQSEAGLAHNSREHVSAHLEQLVERQHRADMFSSVDDGQARVLNGNQDPQDDHEQPDTTVREGESKNITGVSDEAVPATTNV